MPIIRSAKKKLRQDIKRTRLNREVKDTLKQAIKEARTSGKPESTKKAISLLYKAAKKNIIHKNKAARLASRLAKKVGVISKPKKGVKKSSKKSSK